MESSPDSLAGPKGSWGTRQVESEAGLAGERAADRSSAAPGPGAASTPTGPRGAANLPGVDAVRRAGTSASFTRRQTAETAGDNGAEPTVQLDVGRIVVESATPRATRQFRRPSPRVSLDDYRKQRGGGGR